MQQVRSNMTEVAEFFQLTPQEIELYQMLDEIHGAEDQSDEQNFYELYGTWPRN